jgi:zinc protease
MRLKMRSVLIVAVVVGGVAQSQAEDLRPATRLHTVEGITAYRLANGLVVLLAHQSDADAVWIHSVYRVGTIHEGPGERGILEWLRRGALVASGVASSNHGSGFTAIAERDFTTFSFKTTASALPDLLKHPRRAIDSSAIWRGVGKPLESPASGHSAEALDLLHDHLAAMAYTAHPYGRAPLRPYHPIDAISSDTVQRFREAHFTATGTTLIVAGRFDERSTLQTVLRAFDGLAGPAEPLALRTIQEPPQSGPRQIKVQRAVNGGAAGVAYHVPPAGHPDYAGMVLLADALTAKPNSMLHRAVVSGGYAQAVTAKAHAWVEPGLIKFAVSVGANRDPAIPLNVMLGRLERLGPADVTIEDVRSAQQRRLQHIAEALSNPADLGALMSPWIAAGDWRLLFVHRDQVSRIMLSDVLELARRYLRPANRTSGVVIATAEPVDVVIPPAPDVHSQVGSRHADDGEDPVMINTPEHLESLVDRRQLDGGARVAMLQRDTRDSKVNAEFRFRFGSQSSLSGHTTELSLLQGLIDRGIATEDLRGLDSQLVIHGRAGVLGVSIETRGAHIVPLIDLMATHVMTPKWTQDHLDAEIRARQAELRERSSQPRSVAFYAMRRALDPAPSGSVFYLPSFEESSAVLQSVAMQDVQAVHSRMYGAENLHVAIVGEFDKDAVVDVLERRFGTWACQAAFEPIVRPPQAHTVIDETIPLAGSSSAVVIAGANLPVREGTSDFAAARMAAYILGESHDSRLRTRLAHLDRSVSGCGVLFDSTARSTQVSVTAFALCKATDVTLVERAMREELRRWVTAGPTAMELDAARAALTGTLQERLSNDRYIADQLAVGLNGDRSLTVHTDLWARLDMLRVEDVRRLVNSHLSAGQFAWVRTP